MGYQLIEIDESFNAHFIKVLEGPLKDHEWHARFENPHAEKAWANKILPHQWLVWVHLRTGHFGSHHHFTVIYEVTFHHHHHHQVDRVELVEIKEGYHHH